MKVISYGKEPNGANRVEGAQIVVDGQTIHVHRLHGNSYQDKAGRRYELGERK